MLMVRRILKWTLERTVETGVLTLGIIGFLPSSDTQSLPVVAEDFLSGVIIVVTYLAISGYLFTTAWYEITPAQRSLWVNLRGLMLLFWMHMVFLTVIVAPGLDLRFIVRIFVIGSVGVLIASFVAGSVFRSGGISRDKQQEAAN